MSTNSDLGNVLVTAVLYGISFIFNTLRPRQNGRHFTDDTFKCILLNENVRTSIKISLKFVTKGPINNILSLVQIMAWRRLGDKPLSESMMVSLLTHICITRPQWVKGVRPGGHFKNVYELLNLRAPKISMLYKNQILKVWERYSVWNFKGYLYYLMKDVDFIHRWKFKSSQI